jgi:hypothetical protein
LILLFIGENKNIKTVLPTFVTGSSVAACEKATSVNGAGSGLEATSAAKVRL